MTFRDKRIIVTGASSGIGACLARRLAAEGARLALAAPNVPELEIVARECSRSGSEVLTVPTDVTDREQCRALIEQAVQTWNGLDALFLIAGISMWARFDEVSDLTIFEKLVRVNYLGAVYCTHYALPHLKSSHGQIVAMSSSSAKLGAPLHSGYAASKSALHGFFDSLRTELVGTGIHITLACPLFVATAIRLHGFQGDGNHPGRDPYDDSKSMTADECARITLRAARRKKREVLMTLELKAAAKVRPFLPGLVDYFARKKVGLA